MSSQSPSSISNSPYAQWYTRTHLHPSPDTFTPSRSALSFIVAHSAQANPEGFTLAFFKPNIAVDARGRVLEVNQKDFDGIEKLARRTFLDDDLPKAENYLNTWRIKQARTEQPIERLYVPRHLPSSAFQVEVTSVQGYDGKQRELKQDVEGLTKLPDLLCELFGLVVEARGGYVKGEEDKDIIEKVKAILGDAI